MLEETATVQSDVGGSDPPYRPLAKVTCISFSQTKERKRNMRWCMDKARGYKRIQQLVLPDIKDRHDIAIVAGGPTLNYTHPEIAKFRDVMTCGSVHDHAIKLGIKNTLHIECDPSTEQLKNYKTKPDRDVKYLVSTRCHRHMFTRLNEYGDLHLWNMWEGDLGKPIYNGEPAFICGATVTLSAIPVALTLGWKHLHFFGFDSSFESRDKHHAYAQAESAHMMTIRAGDPDNGRQFETTATWVSQVQQFEDMRNHWKFDCTVYGDSLTAEMERLRKINLAGAFNQTKEGVAA